MKNLYGYKHIYLTPLDKILMVCLLRLTAIQQVDYFVLKTMRITWTGKSLKQ